MSALTDLQAAVAANTAAVDAAVTAMTAPGVDTVAIAAAASTLAADTARLVAATPKP